MVDRPTQPGDDAEKASDVEEPAMLGAASPLAVDREPRKKRERTGMRVPRFKAGVGALAVLVLVVLLALVPALFSGLKKTPRDKVGISYGGGPLEGVSYQRTVEPGSSLFFNGFLDPLYLYPADQLNYIISKRTDEGDASVDSVIAPSKDRVQVEYQVATYFKLNTDRLREFHEQLGLKYNAYTSSGWGDLIQDTFRQQIENTLQEETRRSDVAELYGDADLLVTMQERVQATLSQRLADALGGQFFCAPTFEPGGECADPVFVIKSIEIPESVRNAFESNRTSQVQIATKLNEVSQREAEAAGIQALSAALAAAGDDYVLLKAIESGKINFWVLPDSTGVTLAAPDIPQPGEGPPTEPNPAGG